VQLPGVDPTDLVSRHQAEVSAFGTARGRGVVAATLRSAADVEAALDRLILPRISHVNAEQIIKATFGGTALLTLAIRALSRGPLTWADFAIAICIGFHLSGLAHEPRFQQFRNARNVYDFVKASMPREWAARSRTRSTWRSSSSPSGRTASI